MKGKYVFENHIFFSRVITFKIHLPSWMYFFYYFSSSFLEDMLLPMMFSLLMYFILESKNQFGRVDPEWIHVWVFCFAYSNSFVNFICQMLLSVNSQNDMEEETKKYLQVFSNFDFAKKIFIDPRTSLHRARGLLSTRALFSSQNFSKFPVTSNLATHAWSIKYR